jgi:hypothetical protein
VADERFDLSYRGLIAPGADPGDVRRRLTAIFKLTDQGVERLFTGKPVIVKRNVDAAIAAQFEKIFAHAGALLTVTPAEEQESAGEAESPVAARSGEALPAGQGDAPRLTLAPQGGVLGDPPSSASAEIDTSYLSLVPGYDWTLEDCEPPPTPIPEPDLSYLTLVPNEPENADQGGAQAWRNE